MLNTHSFEALANTRLQPHFAIPLYGSYCFDVIPQLIASSLNKSSHPTIPKQIWGDLPQDSDQFLVILLDGFGWRFFQQFGEQLPFFQRFLQSGVASKITSQFPSTTAAHMTTLHTGIPAYQSGVHEWFYYEPLIDRIFAPLLHSTIEESSITPLAPRFDLFPPTSLYEKLAQRGIRSICYQNRKYAHSSYSKAVCRGAEMLPFYTLPEALVNVTEAIARAKGPTYHLLYIDVIDHISHHYGPESPQLEAEITALGHLLETQLHQRLAKKQQQITVLVTADHGQTAVNADETIYLDQQFPNCAHWMRQSTDGRRLVPAGSPRDMFLHIVPDFLDEAVDKLSEGLAERASVYRTETLLEQGLWGPRPSQRLRERLGNVLILPHAHQMVWWSEEGRYTEHKRGHHGALSEEELDIPLLIQVYGQ